MRGEHGISLLFDVFEIGPSCVAQTDFQLAILLPQPPALCPYCLTVKKTPVSSWSLTCFLPSSQGHCTRCQARALGDGGGASHGFPAGLKLGRQYKKL